MSAKLQLVSPSPLRGGGKAAKRQGEGAARQRRDPDTMLSELVPELIGAEETAAALRGLVDSWRRQLADKRGVAFIRHERVIEEFGAQAVRGDCRAPNSAPSVPVRPA